MTEEEIYEIGHASVIMTTERKWECPLLFPGKKPRRTISVLMCVGCCGAAFCTLPASGARAISPISCQRRRWASRRCGPLPAEAAQLYLKRLLQFGIAIKRGGASLQDRMDKKKKPTFSLDLSVCGKNIRGRDICERCWTLPLPRETGWACR